MPLTAVAPLLLLRQPLRHLARDRDDEIEVPIQVQDGQTGELRRRGDEDVGNARLGRPLVGVGTFAEGTSADLSTSHAVTPTLLA